MKVHIFLLCYNEERILPYTLQHYKKNFPNAIITIFDNYSTDRSAAIAEEQGCRVVKYDSNEQQNEELLIWVRSHLWKDFMEKGWVIMCDMDEWLSMTDAQLEEEDAKGTTIVTTQGFNMVGESKMADLSDINLFDIKRGFYDDRMSKSICFKYPEVGIEFWYGAHHCFPQGYIQYSEEAYLLQHYDILGAEYVVEKNQRRYERNYQSREEGLNEHYLLDRDAIISRYQYHLAISIILDASAHTPESPAQ
jgi:glycosyltransferase involved in cell wall biosynthesis